MKYIVKYKTKNMDLNFTLVTSNYSAEQFHEFETREEVEDWIADNQDEVKGITVYEIASTLKLDRQKVKLIRVS